MSEDARHLAHKTALKRLEVLNECIRDLNDGDWCGDPGLTLEWLAEIRYRLRDAADAHYAAKTAVIIWGATPNAPGYAE